MRDIVSLSKVVLTKLENELPDSMFYHSPRHTINVVKNALILAESEGIKTDEKELLHVAALLHDIGFIESRENHEELSCKIAKEVLSTFNFSIREINYICSLIKATKLPQRPTDDLAKILCDADLDYLGREDYFKVADKLFQEFIFFGEIHSKEEWYQQQITFLESHQYFTKTAIRLRQNKKADHLLVLRKHLSARIKNNKND
ncbi:MAG: HD domain-containing protein [Chitinophagaceae bacterium]|nr:MAG: HD domain-containing protein [Chitinophagaceae bacterium]